jgi:hypothetical protein
MASKKTRKKGASAFVRVYKSYHFLDKDPVIDIVRTIVQDSGESYSAVSNMSDVSTTTLYNWFEGKTKRPQYCTVAAVVRALGGDFGITKRPPRLVAAPRKRQARSPA